MKDHDLDALFAVLVRIAKAQEGQAATMERVADALRETNAEIDHASRALYSISVELEAMNPGRGDELRRGVAAMVERGELDP
jgi:hypothetical protein